MKRKPSISAEARENFKREWAEALERNDVTALERLQGSAEGHSWRLEEAHEMSDERDCSTPKLALFFASAMAVILRQKLHIESAERRRLETRVAELERRIGATQMNELAYRGVFREGDMYRQNELVTYQGALWHCKTMTHDRPGSTDWQMMTKTR